MRDRIERAFQRWGHWAYRRAWLVVACAVLLVAGLATQLPGLSFDTSTEGFFHEDNPVRVAYDEFRERFGSDQRILVVIHPPKIFDLAFLEKLRRFHEEIEARVPMLVEVTSLVNARETRGEGDQLIVGELMEEWPETPEQLADLERRARGNPLYIDNLISSDGSLTTILIETQAYSSVGADSAGLGGFDDAGAGAQPSFLTGEETAEIVAALYEVIARYQAPDFEIHAAGTPIMTDQLQLGMRADMLRFTLLAIGLIIGLLALLFRRVAGVVLPLVTVLLSLIGTMSVMAATRTPITIATQILPSFLLAVGVGGSVHILAIFYQARRRGESKQEALAFALGHSGLAVVMTSLTTAGGLVSFMAAELRPISHFGVFAPVGVLVALVFTLALLPALIAVFPMREEQQRRATELAATQRLLVRTGDLASRHAGLTTGVWAVGLVLALVGAFRLELSHSPSEWFPKDHPVRVASDLVNQRMGGSLFIEFVVDTGRPNGLHDPDLLRRFDAIAAEAAGVRVGEMYVGKTLSLVDVVKEIHQALNENRPEYHAIPDDRRLVSQELLLFENSGSDDLEDFVDPQFALGRITMKLPFLDAAGFSDVFDELRRIVDRILDGRAEYVLTGMGVLAGETIHAVMHSILRSYLIAFLVIAPLLMLLIGQVGIGLLAMIPNLAPILMTLGLMGWLGFPLDTFTMLIGSIAIGLAVDDTIHFMHNFRRFYASSGDVRGAIRETLSSTGQAMLFTSLVLSGGFFIYFFASMEVLHRFGLLTAFTIIMAFLADVILAPALLTLATGRRVADAPASASMETTR